MKMEKSSVLLSNVSGIILCCCCSHGLFVACLLGRLRGDCNFDRTLQLVLSAGMDGGRYLNIWMSTGKLVGIGHMGNIYRDWRRCAISSGNNSCVFKLLVDITIGAGSISLSIIFTVHVHDDEFST